MRYEVDVEEYGTISLEAGSGDNAILCVRTDEADLRFDLSIDEFKTFRKALNYVANEIGA